MSFRAPLTTCHSERSEESSPLSKIPRRERPPCRSETIPQAPAPPRVGAFFIHTWNFSPLIPSIPCRERPRVVPWLSSKQVAGASPKRSLALIQKSEANEGKPPMHV